MTPAWRSIIRYKKPTDKFTSCVSAPQSLSPSSPPPLFVRLCSGLSVLLQQDLLPGLDKVDMLCSGVVSCMMTHRVQNRRSHRCCLHILTLWIVWVFTLLQMATWHVIFFCAVKVTKGLYIGYIGCTQWAPHDQVGHQIKNFPLGGVYKVGQRIFKANCSMPQEDGNASQPDVVISFHHCSLTVCQNKPHPCGVTSRGRYMLHKMTFRLRDSYTII